jgi:hypothetical protein
VSSNLASSATLTWKNSAGRRLRMTDGPPGGLKCGPLSGLDSEPRKYRGQTQPRCCAWSRMPWAGLGERTHAAEACARRRAAADRRPGPGHLIDVAGLPVLATVASRATAHGSACLRSARLSGARPGGCSPPPALDRRIPLVHTMAEERQSLTATPDTPANGRRQHGPRHGSGRPDQHRGCPCAPLRIAPPRRSPSSPPPTWQRSHARRPELLDPASISCSRLCPKCRVRQPL